MSKKIFITITIFSLVILVILLLLNRGVNQLNNTEEEKIKELYRELCETSISVDLEKMNSILADNYVLVHMTGMEQTKDEYMDSVSSGELKYYESIHESIEVKINGNKATLIGKTKTLASPFGSSKSWWNLRQDMIMEKIDDEWKIVHSVASTY